MVSGNGTTVVFLKGLLTLSNVYEKLKIFEVIESKNLGKSRRPSWCKKLFLLYKPSPEQLPILV